MRIPGFRIFTLLNYESESETKSPDFNLFRKQTNLQIFICNHFCVDGTQRFTDGVVTEGVFLRYVRTAFLQSIRRDEFHSESVDFVMDICVNFFCGFLGVFLPLKRRTDGKSSLQEEGPNTYGVISEGVFAETFAQILHKICGHLQKLGFRRKTKGGWKTQGRGKHTIKPLPNNVFGPPHP